jgi:hypothetical protein
VKTRNPAKTVIAEVWVRDRFSCCYCGRRTIPANIMRLVSGRAPGAALSTMRFLLVTTEVVIGSVLRVSLGKDLRRLPL